MGQVVPTGADDLARLHRGEQANAFQGDVGLTALEFSKKTPFY
jgi:hypothetical protein